MGSSLVAGAQELFQGLNKRCPVQVRAGLSGKYLGRIFGRVRRILGCGRCSIPLGKNPSSHWQIPWLFALILGNACSPPPTSSAAEGWGWRRCQDKPPPPVGFVEVMYVSMLAKLLYYCLYFFQSQNTAESFPRCVLSSLLSRGIWGCCAVPQKQREPPRDVFSVPQPGLGLSTHHGWGEGGRLLTPWLT